MNFNLMDIYIAKTWFPHKHIQKNKFDDSFKIIYFLFFGKFLSFKKKKIRNCFNWKIPNIENIKLEKYFHEKFECIEKLFHWKTTYIEKLLALKNIYIGKLFALENYFHWKTYLHWKKYFHWKTATKGKKKEKKNTYPLFPTTPHHQKNKSLKILNNPTFLTLATTKLLPPILPKKKTLGLTQKKFTSLSPLKKHSFRKGRNYPILPSWSKKNSFEKDLFFSNPLSPFLKAPLTTCNFFS